MNKAVFLDRDGTVIVHVHYLGDAGQVELERGVVPALQRLHRDGYLLIVITNQSAIGRGLITQDDYLAVNDRMTELLRAQGVPIHAAYHCPHHPTEARGAYLQDCDCRKPKPGMIETAIRDHVVDRSQSFMIGDSVTDVGAGHAAGVRTVLLRTGLGAEASTALGPVAPDHIADDLPDAVDYILRPP